MMDSLKATSNPLRPFKEVLALQQPARIDQPWPMEVGGFKKMPRSGGDPRFGAYSRHGFWYKIRRGGRREFELLVALSYESDRSLLDYENFEDFEEVFGERFILLVAENPREELLGAVFALVYRESRQVVIGGYYVQENWRHSGIGTALLRELLDEISELSHGDSDVTLIFQSPKQLQRKVQRSPLKLRLQDGRKLEHFLVEKPQGLSALLRESEHLAKTLKIVDAKDLSGSQWESLVEMDRIWSGSTSKHTHERSQLLKKQMCRHHALVAIDESRSVLLGFGTLREPAGGEPKRLVVGPLMGQSVEVAKCLLARLLHKYYNPDDDFDFAPDPFAVYRRTVQLIIPEGSVDSMLPVLELLRCRDPQAKTSPPRASKKTKTPVDLDDSPSALPTDGTLEQSRLTFWTAASLDLPILHGGHVFAVGDLHSGIM